MKALSGRRESCWNSRSTGEPPLPRTKARLRRFDRKRERGFRPDREARRRCFANLPAWLRWSQENIRNFNAKAYSLCPIRLDTLQAVPNDVTQLLNAIDSGDPKAAEELLPLVYEDLRRLAAARMAKERPGQTLQATALVHEAWLKLAGSPHQRWQSRRHFFGAAAEAMRRILIDRARKRNRTRHGHGLERIDLQEIEIAETASDQHSCRTENGSYSRPVAADSMMNG
jgi:DNA-directed RNA polymerase specialized sigma24 family protein